MSYNLRIFLAFLFNGKCPSSDAVGADPFDGGIRVRGEDGLGPIVGPARKAYWEYAYGIAVSFSFSISRNPRLRRMQ